MTTALVLENLSMQLRGKVLLHEASATFASGMIHAIVGRSGAGKSVLMKGATGLLPLRGGQVVLPNLVATAGDLNAFQKLRQRVVFVHQDPALLDDLTIEENLFFAIGRREDLDPKEASARIEKWAETLSIDGLMSKRPSQVSPGYQRRIAMVRALCTAPEILVVDEPTTGLDPIAARDVDRALLQLAELGSTLIVITHDLRSLHVLKPSLTFVEDGRVSYQGPKDGDSISSDHPGLATLLAGMPSACYEKSP
jgi:phospholipid/cholesterol/gamma-HCH transport system ATP-binding protein